MSGKCFNQPAGGQVPEDDLSIHAAGNCIALIRRKGDGTDIGRMSGESSYFPAGFHIPELNRLITAGECLFPIGGKDNGVYAGVSQLNKYFRFVLCRGVAGNYRNYE